MYHMRKENFSFSLDLSIETWAFLPDSVANGKLSIILYFVSGLYLSNCIYTNLKKTLFAVYL